MIVSKIIVLVRFVQLPKTSTILFSEIYLFISISFIKTVIFIKRSLPKNLRFFYLDSDFLLIFIPQFCLPLLMEKLSSDIVDAKIDSLLTLVSHFVL